CLLCSGNPVRKIAKRPDTILVRGVPSRWFAETRISSKASTLVTHTIFSALGKIRCILVFSTSVWFIIL
ncbi:Os07g0586000, partial [Oryza sativa Japonica Group]